MHSEENGLRLLDGMTALKRRGHSVTYTLLQNPINVNQYWSIIDFSTNL